MTSVRAGAALRIPGLEAPEAVDLVAKLKDGVVEQLLRVADVLFRLVADRGAALRAGHVGRLREEDGHRSTNIGGTTVLLDTPSTAGEGRAYALNAIACQLAAEHGASVTAFTAIEVPSETATARTLAAARAGGETFM